MALTLNQVIRRVKQISLAHQQIQEFYFGRPSDFYTNHQVRHAAAFLQDTTGNMSLSERTLTLGFKFFFLDLVNVSENAKENELDVLSDMLQVAGDVMASIDHSSYVDWKVTLSNTINFVIESFGDMVAGVVIDMSIQVPYEKDTCVIPTDDPTGRIFTNVFNSVFS